MFRGVLRRLGVAVVIASLVPLSAVTTASAGSDDVALGMIVTSPASDAFETFGALRFRAIGSRTGSPDVYLGVDDVGTAANRIEANFSFNTFATNGNTGTTAGDCRGDYSVGATRLRHRTTSPSPWTVRPMRSLPA